MTRNSTLQASLNARGPIFFCKQSIELKKLNNFWSICVKNIITGKKLWSKCLKILSKYFRRFFRPRRASVPLERQNWKLNHVVDYMLFTNAENYNFLSVIVSEKKICTSRLPKNKKNRDFSKPVVTSSKPKKRISNFCFYLSVLKISWKSVEAFPRNPLHKIRKKNHKNNREKETIE